MKARYTRTMGKWHVQAVTFLTVAMIAGGPTVSMLCDALCADHGLATAVTTANHTTQNSSHHQASSPDGANSHMRQAGEAAGVAHADHQAAAVSTTETLPDSDTLLIRPLGDCCSNLGTDWASVVAVARADSGVRSTTQVAVFLYVPPFNPTGRQPRTWTHAPPSGELSPARTPLVLRV